MPHRFPSDNEDTSDKEPVVDVPLQRKRQCARRKWSDEEIAAVNRQLPHCFITATVPKKDQAEKAIASEPALRRRSWTNVKDFVYNQVKKLKMK